MFICEQTEVNRSVLRLKLWTLTLKIKLYREGPLLCRFLFYFFFYDFVTSKEFCSFRCPCREVSLIVH